MKLTDTVILQAVANAGYRFKQWGDGVVTPNRKLTVEKALNIHAIFEVGAPSPTQYTIGTGVSPAGKGTVFGGGTYNENDNIRLEATPATGYHFDRWSDGDTQNPRNITVTGNATYTAIFKANKCTIVGVASPVGSGSFIPPSISDDYGTDVMITAKPSAGYVFKMWADNHSPNPTRMITLTSSGNIIGIFEEIPIPKYNITVLSSDDNYGFVDPSGTTQYEEGTEIQIKAEANEGYRFVSWNDGNTEELRTIIVTGDATYTAIFTPDSSEEYIISAICEPIEGGRVTGVGSYPEGTPVTLEAIANQGYTFIGWWLDDKEASGVGSIMELVANENQTWTAKFEQSEIPPDIWNVYVDNNTLMIRNINGDSYPLNDFGEMEGSTIVFDVSNIYDSLGEFHLTYTDEQNVEHTITQDGYYADFNGDFVESIIQVNGLDAEDPTVGKYSITIVKEEDRQTVTELYKSSSESWWEGFIPEDSSSSPGGDVSPDEPSDPGFRP